MIVKVQTVNVSVSVIMDEVKLNITNQDLPTYKFEDTYPSFIEAMGAIGRTVEHHKDSSKLVITLEKTDVLKSKKKELIRENNSIELSLMLASCEGLDEALDDTSSTKESKA